mmetsp:Transcript_14585/g.27853  ORF Transcript_14585/g.27853 Transcript_14585/m.27853 type:complete len:317 (-) Transcript_14585:356-1306(-)
MGSTSSIQTRASLYGVPGLFTCGPISSVKYSCTDRVHAMGVRGIVGSGVGTVPAASTPPLFPPTVAPTAAPTTAATTRQMPAAMKALPLLVLRNGTASGCWYSYASGMSRNSASSRSISSGLTICATAALSTNSGMEEERPPAVSTSSSRDGRPSRCMGVTEESLTSAPAALSSSGVTLYRNCSLPSVIASPSSESYPTSPRMICGPEAGVFSDDSCTCTASAGLLSNLDSVDIIVVSPTSRSACSLLVEAEVICWCGAPPEDFSAGEEDAPFSLADLAANDGPRSRPPPRLASASADLISASRPWPYCACAPGTV